MTKTLAIATLALGLFAFGCDDNEDGGTTKPDAAVDASTPDAAKPDTTTNPDTPVGTDTAADTSSTPDGDTSDGGSNADGLGADWTTCTNPMTGISATAFCLQYMTACSFDSTGGATGSERYKSFSDCTMAYESLNSAPAKQGCVAYHLCAASAGGTAMTTHCPHPPQATLPTPGGPCGSL